MPEKRPQADVEKEEFPFEEYLEDAEATEEFPEPKRDSWELSESLSGTFKERLNILKEAIEEIDSEIGIRVTLSSSLGESLKESARKVTGSLNQFEGWVWGYKPSVDFRRTALQRELLGIYREARTEKQRAFSDIVALKKERRKLLMEYKSLKATE